MAGYTPVFDTVFEGSLCGQYPDTAAWLFMLALADRNGHVDRSPQYISTVTGMPRELLLECIERFMAPDPFSRTSDMDGRKLELIDPTRPWGWKIVNHSRYREKARKQVYDAQRTESGRDAERKRDQRAGRPEVAQIVARDGARCGICAQPVDPQEAHVDHIVPASQGGSSDLRNLQLAHSGCNQGKSGGDTHLPARHASMPKTDTEGIGNGPALSRAVPLSEADAKPEAEANKSAREAVPRETIPESQVWERVATLKAKFPKASSEDWLSAEKYARQIVDDGHATWAALIAAVERYARCCRTTGRLVMDPANFFSRRDRPWSQEWAVQDTAPSRAGKKTFDDYQRELHGSGNA